MKYIVGKEWLLKNINQDQVRIVDCRFSLADSKKGRMEYEKSHLPGAVYFGLEKDLSGEVAPHGGRHPMPNIEELTKKLEEAGIGKTTTVVAYDDGEGAFSARFWWLLSYLGHEKAYILDGGYKGWIETNYPITTEIPFFKKSSFQISIQPAIMAEMAEVKKISTGYSDHVVLIDSREEKRYLGIEEPIDKKKGHIPGAINKPWFEGFHEGRYKSVEEQKQRFADLTPDKEIIVYCGSGVTAAPNFLALKEAGFEKVKLYVGSFSDWISYGENEID